MNLILGFLAAKMGYSLSSRRSKGFIHGWFIGTGVIVKSWQWKSREIGKRRLKLGLFLLTRKCYKVGFFSSEKEKRVIHLFSFGYGGVIFSFTKN